MTTDVEEAVAAAASVLGGRARSQVSLAPFTTYRVGGPAALHTVIEGDDDLHLVRTAVAASGLPVLVVGRGSNLLVADRGFPGLAVSLGERFAGIAAGETGVVAGGAAALPVLARRTAALGLRGLEWAVGVPGSVGGAVRMNAGGHGSDIAASLVRARVFDLAAPAGTPALDVAPADLGLGYRTSSVQGPQVVVEAELALTPGERAEAEAEVAAVVAWRRRHQPGGANAGSVFANPEGDSAGRLIDAAGLRGHRRASACVSPKHANFVQVDDGGSADDVLALVEEVRTVVRQRFGIDLRLENRLVGFDYASPEPGSPLTGG